jgi:putative membrane protein
MKRSAIAIALVGVLVAIGLIAWAGLGDVGHALARAGWQGVAFLSVFWLGLFCVLGCAWYVLIPPAEKPRLWTYAWGRIVRDSATEILPFSPLGGLVIGARAVVLNAVTVPVAFASTVVDITAEMLSQIVFTILGLILLATRVTNFSWNDPPVIGAVLGVAAAVVATVAFIVFQIRGGIIVEKMVGFLLPKALPQADAVNAMIRVIYDNPVRLALASFIHLICWMLAAVGVWGLLQLMGVEIDFLAVMGIESLAAAARSAAFAIPAGAGVQEGAYVFFGRLFGLDAQTALAISLLKRVRDFVIGVPALLIWQGVEGGRLFVRARARKDVSGE